MGRKPELNKHGVPVIPKNKFIKAVNGHLLKFKENLPYDSKTFLSIDRHDDWHIVLDTAIHEQSLGRTWVRIAHYMNDMVGILDKYYCNPFKVIK